MSSHNHWRGKLLVDMSTGNVSIQKSQECTSDTFNSRGYDPTLLRSNPSNSNEFSNYNLPLSDGEIGELSPNSALHVNDCTGICSPMQFDIMPQDSTCFPELLESEIANSPPPNHVVLPVEAQQLNLISPVHLLAPTLCKQSDPAISILPSNAIESNCPILQTETETSNKINKNKTNSIIDNRTGSEQHIVKPFNGESNQTSKMNIRNNFILDEYTGLLVARNNDLNECTEHNSSNYVLDDQTGELIEINQDSIYEPDTEEIDIFEKKKDRQFNKTQRVKGKQYMGRKRERVQNENQHLVTFVSKTKKGKKLKPCSHESTVLKTSRSYLCEALSEEQRDHIFNYFWDLDTWQAKKAYLKNLIRIRPILKRRKNSRSDSSKKQLGFDYYLPGDNGEQVRVCKNFLLCTIDMQNDTLTDWVKELNEDNLGKHSVRTKKQKHSANASAEDVPRKSVTVKEWLTLLPKVPSHYCRSSTSRIYVEEGFRSKSHMFKEYKKWCVQYNKGAVQRKLFCSVLKMEKISIFKPRKDQCDTCTAFKEGNITAEEYDIHKEMKEEAYSAKEEAKSMCSSEVLVITVDVQSVLLCPKLTVSVQYYKQKLQLHNYTIYCNNDKEVHLYVWHEGDGGVTANEFTTCLLDFLMIKIEEGYKKIIVISDGCTYQNRNKILSSALVNLTKLHQNVEIEQRILEKGHTMMEVDSVHSTLEHLFRPPIFSPDSYLTLMSQARPRNPYTIHHLDYTFFKDYEQTCSLDSIRPGKKAGDPVVTDIRALFYKGGEIYYKLRHPQEWKMLPQRVRVNNSTLLQLYSTPRKIEKSKYDSLQSLKKYIHRDNHHFYDNLLHD